MHEKLTKFMSNDTVKSFIVIFLDNIHKDYLLDLDEMYNKSYDSDCNPGGFRKLLTIFFSVGILLKYFVVHFRQIKYKSSWSIISISLHCRCLLL